MFDRVLVALDRSDRTEDVLPHVRTIACAFASHINLVHVFEDKTRLSYVDPLDWYMERGKAQAHLKLICNKLVDSLLPVEPVLLDGSVAERILAYAGESSASLIVLHHGSRRHSEPQTSQSLAPAVGPEPLTGHVAYKVASRARQSLLVARTAGNESKTRRPGAYRRILLPLDGSKRAEHVLPAATALAIQCQATLVLAHVVACPQQIGEGGAPGAVSSYDPASELVARNYQEAQAYLNHLQSQVAAPAETHLVVDHDPIAALHRLSREQDADLVLLSAHGYSCRKQQPYGRVAGSFLYEGDTSVLVVQDVPAHEIGLSPAERAAEVSGHQPLKRQNTVPTISFQ